MSWQPIATYPNGPKQVLCGHAETKWIRFGRLYPEFRKWYYSGTNERSQWAQVEGDEPTHWMPMPEAPR
jgi:hypothetical protein